jgi:hypothetical protein
MKQKLKCHFSPPTKGDGIKTNDNSEDLFVTVKVSECAPSHPFFNAHH